LSAFLRRHGLTINGRVLVMGIMNVTPDSFSDGGRLQTVENVLSQATAMVTAGADILDIGGESTRPAAAPVARAEERARVVPAILAIRQAYPTLPISIDTTKAEVARAACQAGATIINDISALRFDPAMAAVIREYDTPVIIMHMQGTPGDMQKNPAYGDVVTEIAAFLEERLRWLEGQAITRERVIVDPGIGFGKTMAHNLDILGHLERFAALGCPVLIGHSRKSFLGKLLNLEVDQRDLATAVVSALCAAKGAAILRVHDVAGTIQAVRLAQAIPRGVT